MKVINTEIPEVKIIEPQIFRDGRGYFYESFNQEKIFRIGMSRNQIRPRQ